MAKIFVAVDREAGSAWYASRDKAKLLKAETGSGTIGDDVREGTIDIQSVDLI